MAQNPPPYDAAVDAPDEFNWNSDESVVVKRTHAVAVYRNVAGDITIRQERDPMIEETDPIIVIPFASARRFIEAVEKALLP